MAAPRRTVRSPRVSTNSTKGKRTNEQQVMIAAAEAVCGEIKLAVSEAVGDNRIAVWPWRLFQTSMTSSLASKTKAGWRMLEYHTHQGYEWSGDLRASTTGTILFGFKPLPNAGNKAIEEREVTLVEVPHTALNEVFGGFPGGLERILGASIESLLQQATMTVSAEALAAANLKDDDQHVPVAIEQVIPQWGAWA